MIVFDEEVELLAEHASRAVHLVDGEAGAVLSRERERRLRARQRSEKADLDPLRRRSLLASARSRQHGREYKENGARAPHTKDCKLDPLAS